MIASHLPVLLSDFIGMTLIVCALAATDTHIRTSDTIRRLLITMGVITFISCLADIGVRLTEGHPGIAEHHFIYWCKSILFLTEADIGLFWLCFIDYYLNRDKARQRKWRPWLAVLVYLVAVLLVVNVFTPCVFRVSARNIYTRGGVCFDLVNLVPVFYLLLSLIVAWQYRRRHGHFRFFNMATFLVPVVIGFGFHLMGLRYDIAWTMVAVGLVSVVLSLQSRMVYVDALTGLYTRAYMDRIFARSAADVRGGMMIDINYFKSVNDHYGHAEGDRALSEIGQILNHSITTEGIAVRLAGDEFILLFNLDDIATIEALKKNIKREADAVSAKRNLPYKLSVSCGIGQFDAERETQDIFLKRLDHAMYQDKAAFYQTHPELERRQ